MDCGRIEHGPMPLEQGMIKMLACPHCVSTIIIAVAASGGAMWGVIRSGIIGSFIRKLRRKR